MSIAQVMGHRFWFTSQPPIVETLLRQRELIWDQVRQENDLDRLIQCLGGWDALYEPTNRGRWDRFGACRPAG